MDALDTSSQTYDLGLFGGSIDIQNGLSTGGELFVQANTGNINVNNGQVSAVGQSVFDVQQGAFRTNMDGNAFNITGGNYILYADNVFSSDVSAFNGLAEFRFEENSTSLTPLTLGTTDDFVVLRDDFIDISNNLAADDLLNFYAQSDQYTDAPISSIDVPNPDRRVDNPFVEKNEKISGQALENIDDKISIDGNPLNSDAKGIGTTNSNCTVTSSREIICDTAKSSK